jgi:hypothetical protein
VDVSAGDISAVFLYRPRSWFWGVWISIAALSAISAAGWIGLKGLLV